MATVPMSSVVPAVRGAVLAAVLGTAPLPAWSQAGVLHVQPDASQVKYFITHTLNDVHDTAGKASGEVRVAPARGGAWRLAGTVNVDLRQLDTGIDQRTKHVKSAEYLDVEKFPLATFEFTSVTCDSPHVHIPPPPTEPTAGQEPVDGAPPIQQWKGRAGGSFTMHGVKRDIEVPVLCTWEGETLKVHGTFRIKLADHGVKRVKKMMMAAGENVDVTLDLLFAP